VFVFSLHRDLKYENVLFVDENPMAEVKLIDFGLSTQFFDTAKELTDGVGTMYVLTSYFARFPLKSLNFTPNLLVLCFFCLQIYHGTRSLDG
jgi:serine/threonine protein kinase